MAELTIEVFEEKIDSFAKIVKGSFDVVEFTMRSNHEEMKKEIQRLDGRMDKLSDHVGAFIQLHQKLDIELIALRQKYDLLAVRIARLEGVPA